MEGIRSSTEPADAPVDGLTSSSAWLESVARLLGDPPSVLGQVGGVEAAQPSGLQVADVASVVQCCLDDQRE
jgi:hypothetical protein